jgi:hypothetical protein
VTGDTSVTIGGDFTKAVGQAVICKFNGVIASDITLVTASEITCISPQQSAEGYVDITLSICGSVATLAKTQYYYYKKPNIQVYSPSSIPVSGGQVRFVLQSDFKWFSTQEAVVEIFHTPTSFNSKVPGTLLAVDELLAEQPRGSSYKDKGFPFSNSAQDVRFQFVYTWLQMKASGLEAGDEITKMSVLPAECPSFDTSNFRISVLVAEGDPVDSLPKDAKEVIF